MPAIFVAVPLKAIPVADSEEFSVGNDLTQLSNQQLLHRYKKSEEQRPKDYCQSAAILSEMNDRGGYTGPIEQSMHRFNLVCALSLKSWEVAYSHLVLLENFSGENKPRGAWGFRIALVANEGSDAVDRLGAIASDPNSKQLMTLEPEVIFQLSRLLYRSEMPDKATKMYSSLFRSPHFSELDSNLQSASAFHVFEEQLDNGEVEEFAGTLKYITSPYQYLEMLADRKFENAWPTIEQRAGLNMADILNKYAAVQRSQFEVDQTDKAAKQRLAHALHFAGKFEDVIELTDSIDKSEEGSLLWEEDDGWALNLRIYALDALGDQTPADQLFDRFAAIPYDQKTNGWLVNFTINRASRLVGQRRFNEGLVAAEHAAKIVEKSGSPFAKMLVWQAKACALHYLGRSDEAKLVLKIVEENHEDSLQIAAETYLCFDDRDRAADLVLKALKDDSKRSNIIGVLQKPNFELFYTDSALPNIHDELRRHPKVERIFDEVAREIPDDYVPLIGKRRDELKAARTISQ